MSAVEAFVDRTFSTHALILWFGSGGRPGHKYRSSALSKTPGACHCPGNTLRSAPTTERHARGRLDFWPWTPKLPSMPSRKKDSPAKLPGRMKRRWRVVLLRNKGEILGQVEAPDVAAAKAAAVVQFELDDVQRNRIMVQELGDGGPARQVLRGASWRPPQGRG